jgi:hypothetical protein
MAPFVLKLGQNAFHTIPNIRFCDSEQLFSGREGGRTVCGGGEGGGTDSEHMLMCACPLHHVIFISFVLQLDALTNISSDVLQIHLSMFTHYAAIVCISHPFGFIAPSAHAAPKIAALPPMSYFFTSN